MLSYSIAAFGASLSAIGLFRVLRAMRYAETAGIAAVAGGIAETNVAVLVGLYLAIGGGFVAIITAAVRAVVETTTASPPAWFYFVAVLSFISVGLLWITESIFIPALYPGSAGISAIAPTIETLVIATMIIGPLSALVLLIVSVLPLKSKSQTQWPAILMLVVIQVVLIGATIAFQMRTFWLWRVVEAESFG
jgi:hypothetical protein